MAEDILQLQEILAATTVDFLVRQPITLTLNHTPFLKELFNKGRVKRTSFSSEYKTYISGQYDGAEYIGKDGVIKTDYQVSPIEATWKVRTLPALVNFNRDLVEFRSSPNIVIDHINVKFSEATGAMLSTIDASLYSKETEAGGNALAGLRDAVSKTPDIGVYAGVDRATNQQWRNHAVIANGEAPANQSPSVFNKTPTTADNILARINACISMLDYNGGYFSNRIILASSDFYNLINEAITKTGRNVMSSSDTLYYGANKLDIRGIPVINAGGLKFTNTKYQGIEAKTLYILNLDTFTLEYINNQVNWLKEVIKKSKSYKASEIDLDKGLMFFSLPGIDRGDQWWMKRAVNNLHYCAQLTADLVFSCINPAFNLVMYDEETENARSRK